MFLRDRPIQSIQERTSLECCAPPAKSGSAGPSAPWFKVLFQLQEALFIELIAEHGDENSEQGDNQATQPNPDRLGVKCGIKPTAKHSREGGIQRKVEHINPITVLSEESHRSEERRVGKEGRTR